ncbi:F-box domain-containing protein [Mycena chlorophos]|uniref:F-box domain-containing protein n=1 Tax=Mycena chlorophos TaxID=658473 RepID=A0A8H6TIV6_MYCCL|nr:F-box domain-containing protein [Mycena chlorophos]
MARNPPHPHPSELHRLLASNEVPTTSEERTLRAVLEDHRAHAAALTIQIDHQLSILRELTEKRDEVNEAIHGINTALAPVRRLPAEVLGEVFLWALKSYHPQGGTRAPWYLGQVCRSWRSIALYLPRLWSKVVIHDAQHESEQTLRKWKREIEEQLARSAATPLSVFIAWRTPQPENLAQYGELVELVVAHCERWRRFGVMSLGDINGLLTLLEPAQGRLPHLERLHLQLYHPRLHRSSSNVFIQAPKLVHLHLLYTRLDYIALPWTQIRKCLIERRGFMPVFLGPLTSAHGLTTLQLNIKAEMDDEPIHDVDTLPGLRYFGGTVAGLASLVAPALETLSLRLMWNLELNILRDFLVRSPCNLRALHIKMDENTFQGWEPDVTNLVAILRSIPSLELLILTPSLWLKEDAEEEQNHPMSSIQTLFSAMRLNQRADDLLPNLSTFAFSLPYGAFETDAFLEMARSRAFTQMYLPAAWKARLLRDCGDHVEWRDADEIQILCEASFPTR